jgi:hypothetical protein
MSAAVTLTTLMPLPDSMLRTQRTAWPCAAHTKGGTPKSPVNSLQELQRLPNAGAL